MGNELDTELNDLVSAGGADFDRLMDVYEPLEVGYSLANQAFGQVVEGTGTADLPLSFAQVSDGA